MRGSATTERAAGVDTIRRASVPVFAAQGFRGTPMADLARAARMSRPALYQYSDDRADLFRAALQAVSEDATDVALAALDGDGTVAERLDAHLQRLKADGDESLAATPFGVELMEARREFAAEVAQAAFDRARRRLQAFVPSNSTVDARTHTAAIDMLIPSPAGLGSDDPWQRPPAGVD